MKNTKTVGYIISAISIIFLVFYLTDLINEWLYVALLYKFPCFYGIKLIYSIFFLVGGILLIVGSRYSWPVINFVSIGILISWCWIFLTDWFFRTTLLDYFFMEILALYALILFNNKFFASKIGFVVPSHRWKILSLFVILNLGLSYLVWVLRWLEWNDILKWLRWHNIL